MGRQFFLSTGVRPSRNVYKHALDTNRKQREMRLPTSYQRRYEHFMSGMTYQESQLARGHLVAHVLATFTKS